MSVLVQLGVPFYVNSPDQKWDQHAWGEVSITNFKRSDFVNYQLSEVINCRNHIHILEFPSVCPFVRAYIFTFFTFFTFFPYEAVI